MRPVAAQQLLGPEGPSSEGIGTAPTLEGNFGPPEVIGQLQAAQEVTFFSYSTLVFAALLYGARHLCLYPLIVTFSSIF